MLGEVAVAVAPAIEVVLFDGEVDSSGHFAQLCVEDVGRVSIQALDRNSRQVFPIGPSDVEDVSSAESASATSDDMFVAVLIFDADAVRDRSDDHNALLALAHMPAETEPSAEPRNLSSIRA
jgi:hypothetical protein